MKNIADHILDIVENSTRAEATKVEVLLSINNAMNLIKLSFIDDGVGMSEELVERIKDPFFSTRKERRIGMGIPLLIQNSEMAGGEVTISSHEGEGTIVVATFEADNLDCPPLGDVADAIYFLASSHMDVRLIFTYTYDRVSFVWDTKEVAEVLDGIPINSHQVKEALLEMLNSNMAVTVA